MGHFNNYTSCCPDKQAVATHRKLKIRSTTDKASITVTTLLSWSTQSKWSEKIIASILCSNIQTSANQILKNHRVKYSRFYNLKETRPKSKEKTQKMYLRLSKNWKIWSLAIKTKTGRSTSQAKIASNRWRNHTRSFIDNQSYSVSSVVPHRILLRRAELI